VVPHAVGELVLEGKVNPSWGWAYRDRRTSRY
jgi:hypothetical protein